MIRCAVATICCLAFAALAHAATPNVVLILSDDQRHDTIHALGNDEIQTPNLDKLVARGTTFKNTYIMGSTQPAVCVCSRACLMSGRSLFRAPADLKNVPLLPKLLSQAGVHTYGIGKWHNSPASYAAAFDDGAAVFFGGMHNHSKIPVFAFNKQGKYPRTAQQITDEFSTELFADKAVSFVNNYSDEKPYFLYVALTAPHDPRTPPGKYKTMYDPAKLTLPKNFLPEHPFDNGELKIRDENLAPFPRTEAVLRQHLADYYGMISHLDEQVGRILEAIAQSPQADNTIIVFASDNGLAVGQHGLLGKQSMYEHSVRVPLVMAGPGLDAKRQVNQPVYLHDLFTTIATWQGAKLPKDVESQDLMPLVRGEASEDRVIFAAYRDVQRMVRVGEFKLIEYPKAGRTQLFDLAHDPWEMHDLFGDVVHGNRCQGLRDRLAEAQEQYADPLLSKNAR